MSLTKAIKFQYLFNQLTQTEKHQFVDKLSCDNDIIAKSLFYYIVNASLNQQCDSDTINNTISNIIRSRKKNPYSIQAQNVTINDLPQRLIGVISSFLTQQNYINFSYTNRFNYLGCNTPNLLQELNLIKYNNLNYSAINLQLFPSIQDLRIKLPKFNELFPSVDNVSHTVMNELHTIELHGDNKLDMNIDDFLTTKCNFNNITLLALLHLGHYENGNFSSNTFIKLLKAFPNTQYLYFRNVNVDIDNFDMNFNIKQLYPEIKGLKLNGNYDDFNRWLMHTYGSNLEYLFLSENDDFDFNLQVINFHKLEQLRMIDPTIKTLNDILKTASNLKQIQIQLTHETTLTDKEKKEIMTKFIVSNKSLEYIKVLDRSKSIQHSLEGIKDGLFRTKTWKRNAMTIKVWIACDIEFEPKHLMKNVCKMISLLESSEIKDFRFILTFDKLNTNINTEDLKSLSTNITMYKYNKKIVINNKQCKINGHGKLWKIRSSASSNLITNNCDLFNF
eukprot:170112_1